VFRSGTNAAREVAEYQAGGEFPSTSKEGGRPTTNDTAIAFTFTGEQTDASSGLEYLRARYYDSAAGRFISRDPAGGGYPYGANNPARMFDPSGLYPICGAPSEYGPLPCFDSTEVYLPAEPPLGCSGPGGTGQCVYPDGAAYQTGGGVNIYEGQAEFLIPPHDGNGTPTGGAAATPTPASSPAPVPAPTPGPCGTPTPSGEFGPCGQPGQRSYDEPDLFGISILIARIGIAGAAARTCYEVVQALPQTQPSGEPHIDRAKAAAPIAAAIGCAVGSFFFDFDPRP